MRFPTNPRRFGLLSCVSLSLALAAIAPAATITWTGATSASYEEPANWSGGVAPADDLITDIATFATVPGPLSPLLSAPRSVNGLKFSNANGGWSLGGASLGVGASGISSVGQNSGVNSITSDIAIGAPQNWRAGSGGTLSLTGSLAQSSGHVLTLGSSTATGTIVINPAPSEVVSLTGAAGASSNLVRILAGGVLVCGADGPEGSTGTHVIRNDTGPSLAILTGGSAEFRSGTWSIGDLGRNSSSDAFYGDLKVGGGDVSFVGGRYLGSGRVTVTGGNLRFLNAGSAVSNGGRFALGSFGTTGTAMLDLTGGSVELAPANVGNSFGVGISTRVNHTGGTLRNALSGGGGVNGGSVNTLTLGAGGSVSNNKTSYTLAGSAVLLSAGAIQGQAPGTGTGNLSNFNFNGGTLAAGSFHATYLGYASATGLVGGPPSADPVANSVGLGTLHNHGGTIAPGGMGNAGRFSLVGNYQIHSGTTAIEIGGGSPAAGFQGPGHDLVAVTGGATLGGDLMVSLLPGFTPAASDSLVVITATSISGAFANAPSGSRIATHDLSATFLVTIGTQSVTLSEYRPLIAPTITTQPQSSTVVIGDAVTFTVTAASDLPPFYQWRRNGVPIPGAVSSSYSISSVLLEHAGSYDVVISHPAGSVTSAVAVLEVGRFPAAVLGERVIQYDSTGIRALSKAPASSVHPRIYFNAEDLPDIRSRLATTATGQEAMTMIRLYTDILRRGRTLAYDSRPSSFKIMPDGSARLSNAGLYDRSAVYNDLAAGSSSLLDAMVLGTSGDTFSFTLAGLMSLEAFECLVDEGQPGVATRAANLANALDTWATWVLTQSDFPGPPGATFGARFSRQYKFGGHLNALTYDMAYHAMTPIQRNNTRKALARLMGGYFASDNSNTDYTGVDCAPEAVATNWVAINSFKLITACAIEGEVSAGDAGYSSQDLDAWFRRAVGSYHKFLTYGWFSNGAPLEGLGKNYLFGGHMIPLARRGYDFFGHPHLREYANRWMAALAQPYGYSFTAFDLLGGSGSHPERGRYFLNSQDYVALKWMFPDSPATDFCWRNFIRTEYKDALGQQQSFVDFRDSRFTLRNVYQNQLLPAAIFASDVSSAADWASHNATARPSLDHVDAEGGTVISRSGQDANATSLLFHVRQDMGGHTFADRNTFTLSSLGRIFINYNSGSTNSGLQAGSLQSIVEVDGQSMTLTPKEGVKMRIPSKLAAWTGTGGSAMFATGDATYAYSNEWTWNNYSTSSPVISAGYTLDSTNHNTFRRSGNTIPEAFGNRGFSSFPHWVTPGMFEGIQAKPFNPMRQVIRTVGLVRGSHPYALVIDDVRKDDSARTYKWFASIAEDLTLLTGSQLPAACDPLTDVVLSEPAATGDRMLLVRILSAKGTPVLGSGSSVQGSSLAYTEVLENSPTSENWKRLVIERAAIAAPDFRILLYPFRAGTAIPTVAQTASTLSISIGAQTDLFTFTPRTALVSGQAVSMSEFTLSRGGQVLADYRNQIEPAPLRSPTGMATLLPAAPTALAASASGRFVNLAWTDQATGESGYVVERSLAGTEDWMPVAASLPANSRSFIDVTTADHTAYDYRVRCVSSAGLSAYASLASVTTGAGSPDLSPPSPWTVQQLGSVPGALSGSAAYNSLSTSFHVAGGGGDIWSGTNEAFTFIHQPWSGDGVFTARIVSFSSSDSAAKAGIMVRESLSVGAKNSTLYLTPAGSAFFQWKTSTNGSVSNTSSSGKAAPLWIRLARSGHTFTAFTSPDGTLWTQLGTSRIVTLSGAPVFAGLAIGPRTVGTLSSVVFDHVSFVPVSPVQLPGIDLNALAVSDSQIRLDWSGNVPGVSHWKLERSPAGMGAWSVIEASLSAETLAFTDVGLEPFTAYDYRLGGYDASGLMAEETFSTATAAAIGDGIPGWWRLLHFGNGLAVMAGSSGGQDDPDGDGNSNLTEFLAGTAPMDSQSRFHISSIVRDGAVSVLSLPTVPGHSYQVQRATSPSGPWVDVSPAFVATGNSASLPVADPPSGAPAAFYRAKVEP